MTNRASYILNTVKIELLGHIGLNNQCRFTRGDAFYEEEMGVLSFAPRVAK